MDTTIAAAAAITVIDTEAWCEATVEDAVRAGLNAYIDDPDDACFEQEQSGRQYVIARWEEFRDEHGFAPCAKAELEEWFDTAWLEQTTDESYQQLHEREWRHR